MKVVAVVPAAGIGQRFGGERNKAFFSFLGRPLIVWSLQALQNADAVSEIIPVVKASDVEATETLVAGIGISKVKSIVTGGAQRQDSVYQGIGRVSSATDAVLIHDGARPLLDAALIDRVIDALPGFDGAVCGVPVKDTIKETGDGHDAPVLTVRKTLVRDRLWAIQTPQIFFFGALLAAYERALSEGILATDDAALVEHYGGSVRIVEGSYRNIKITTPEDILVAEALMK